MKLKDFAVVAALAVGLILPAAAQTGSTKPITSPAAAMTPSTKPTTPSGSSIGVNQPSKAAAPVANADLVDINTASPAALDALPGIGKARADAIVRNRPYHGKDDLLSRHIVPPNVYNSIKDKIIARQG